MVALSKVLDTATSVADPGGSRPAALFGGCDLFGDGRKTGDSSVPWQIHRSVDIYAFGRRSLIFPRQSMVNVRQYSLKRFDADGNRTIQSARVRSLLAGSPGRGELFEAKNPTTRARNITLETSILSGTAPYGPCAQLYAGRRGEAICARSAATCSIRRAGMRLACRLRTPHVTTSQPARMDANIATMKAQPGRRWACRAGLEPPAVRDPDYYTQQKPFLDFWKAGRTQISHEVNWDPGRHDRAADERAGDRRALALRRACRAARPDAVVLQDHVDRSCWMAWRRWIAGRTRSSWMQENGSAARKGC